MNMTEHLYSQKMPEKYSKQREIEFEIRNLDLLGERAEEIDSNIRALLRNIETIRVIYKIF